MYDITRKKYNGEMKFTVTRAYTHKTVAELREELLRVKSIVDYWEDKSDKRAFGEIKAGNISFEKWREIYASFGWIELEEYRCFYNPKSVSINEDMITSLPSIEGNSDNEQSGTWASYELDKSYSSFWKVWNKYYQKWHFRLNKLEMARFDMRRVSQTQTTRIEEALFVLLGLSPSVQGTEGFENFSLSERLFETDSIEYQDYQGNKLVINSNLYSNDDYGHLEWYLKQKKEYALIERLATRGQPSDFSDRLSSAKFNEWAYKNNYIEDRVPMIRNTGESPFGEGFAFSLFNGLVEVGYLKGSFDCMWNLADGMSWMSLHYLANEIVNRKLIQTNSPFEHIKKYIHYASTYPLEDQFFKPAIDKFSETDDEKIFKQECDLINSALDNIEPNKAINYGE
ncbi:hypothetical protein OAS32_02305 [Candidatus Pseudothioglobus singularis]|nr:hypothetical protein [Candidatus Pseudothioglobus singularis]